MRAFENREDCAVVDEPFYAAYLAATGLDHPARDAILASQSQSWEAVSEQLRRETPAPIYYQKHMTQHLLAGMDLTFTEQLINCFLIRDPSRIVASYAKVRRTFELEELGFPQQKALFDRECHRLGEAPPVLDAARTLADPAGSLSALCDRLAVPFTDAMLSWPAGPRDSDGVWAPHWYAAVWSSTGFTSPESSDREVRQLTQEQQRMCEVAQESYEEMLIYATTGAL